ncbi:MAG: hypothetical protein ACOYLP_10915 [Flavobacterium sp.]|uniref:hypothetical protein n=1 Tax=Flavobacterium sp. TaxID=239 RepID=UPI003BBC21BD
MIFIQALQQRNKWLYVLGCIVFVLGIISLGFLLFDSRTVNGISLWSLPFRFSIASGVYIFTIAWLSFLINNTHFRKAITILIFILFSCLLSIVFFQLIKEHIAFIANETPFDQLLNQLSMTLFLCLLFLQIWITTHFFRQKKNMHSQHFTWGVRMGFFVFTFFLFMLATLFLFRDKTEGISLFQFERGLSFEIQASFYLGLHSIQIIPLLSYYLFDQKKQVVFFSIAYVVLILVLIVLFFLKSF